MRIRRRREDKGDVGGDVRRKLDEEKMCRRVDKGGVLMIIR